MQTFNSICAYVHALLVMTLFWSMHVSSQLWGKASFAPDRGKGGGWSVINGTTFAIEGWRLLEAEGPAKCHIFRNFLLKMQTKCGLFPGKR